MSIPLAFFLGAAAGGLGAGFGAGLAIWLWGRLRRSRPQPARVRPLALATLLSLRSGGSVLSALEGIAASPQLPLAAAVNDLVRRARVDGLAAAATASDASIRTFAMELARAQATGASISETLRRLIDSELEEERSRRLRWARTLPMRLMFPITLLVLPGFVLLVYGPGLLALLGQLTGPLGS